MKMLLVLCLSAVLGIGLYIFFQKPGHHPDWQEVGSTLSEGAHQMKDALSQQITNLDTEQIKTEMARTGRVARKKAGEVSAKMMDVAADVQITANIKKQYAFESELSALSISVNTTHGVVTLAGRVPSHENIQKAMRLALSTEGVTEVISTLQVK